MSKNRNRFRLWLPMGNVCESLLWRSRANWPRGKEEIRNRASFSSALGELVTSNRATKARTIYEFLIGDRHPDFLCLNRPSHFSLNQHHRICFMWAPSYDHKLCIKTSQNGFGLDPAFCTSKPRKKTFFFPLNFHRSINKGMVEEHIKKHIISFMCCL